MSQMNQDQNSGQQSYTSPPTSLIDAFGIVPILQMLRRRLLVMAAVGIAAGAIGLTVFMLGKPMFQATATVMINPRQERVVTNAENVLGAMPTDSAAIDSEIELLKSPTMVDKLTEALAEIDAETAAPGTAPQGLGGAVNVRRRGLTYVIEMSATSPDPERARLIANTYADTYLAYQIESRAGSTQRANDWLSRRLVQLREDVQKKEAAVEVFRAQSGLTTAGGASLVEQQITNVQSSVLQAQADLAEREARYQQLRDLQNSGAALDTIGNALNSGTILQLRNQEADIARRQSDLENRYLPTHPAVQSIRSEREDIQRQIQMEIQRISTNLGNEVDVARARLRTLQSSLNAITSELNSNSSDAVRLRELEREAAASREVYESYLQRYQEIADQDELNTSDARLMSYAPLPLVPSSPNLRVSLVLAIAIGLLCGLAAGVIAEMMDQSIKNADDLETKVGYPAIASIPVISDRMMRTMPPNERHPAGYLVGRPMSAFTEALRVLRTMIVYSKIDFSSRVVAVASALPDEGKTTISLCLARVAAMSGQKVLVVDCDLRKQSINDIVDIEPSVGILEVLAGETSWRDAVLRDPQSDADILPASTASFTPRDVFGSDAMTRLISDLRAHYDLIILDCAPLLAVAETRVIVRHADSVVMVARAGKSAVGAVRSAIAQTVAAGGKVLGVALNRVSPNGQSYADSLYFYQSKSYYSVS